MKAAIKANIILLPLVAFYFAPLAVVPYLALLLIVSHKSKRFSKVWVDYYRVITRLEYKYLVKRSIKAEASC